MKNLILAILPVLFLPMAARAQKPHEVNLSIGGAAGGVNWFYSQGPGIEEKGTDLYSIYEPAVRIQGSTVLAVDYTYSVYTWLKPGIDLSFGMVEASRRRPRAYYSDQIDYSSQCLVTIMPQVKFFALSKPHIKIYGKVGYGGQFYTGAFTAAGIRPAWQIVPLGLQWGGEMIYAWAEAGYGNVCHARLGVGIRF